MAQTHVLYILTWEIKKASFFKIFIYFLPSMILTLKLARRLKHSSFEAGTAKITDMHGSMVRVRCYTFNDNYAIYPNLIGASTRSRAPSSIFVHAHTIRYVYLFLFA